MNHLINIQITVNNVKKLPFIIHFKSSIQKQRLNTSKKNKITQKKCNENKKFDKDIATAINMGLNTDEDLKDECAGWHVIVGKSFASAITY